MKLIKNVRMITPGKIVRGNIAFTDEIIGIGEEVTVSGQEDKEIEGGGKYLAPGFIDIHIHGAGGYDTMDQAPDALNKISESIIKSGVTSFLPTIMTMPAVRIREALENVRKARKEGTGGARVLGANVEGPFISEDYRGAQNAEYSEKPAPGLLEDFLDIVKIITVAPESKGSNRLIEFLTEHQVTVAAGHSGATYEEIMEAREWGLSHITHLFNAMTGLHHRQPGIVGAALEKEFTCELITDFIHIHPAVVRLAIKTKDLKNLILITDQIRAGSMGEGVYELGGQEVTVQNGEARLENGDLAGSVLTLDQAVRNIMSLEILNLPEVISMVTLNPAVLLGVDDYLGRLAPGYRADLVLLNKDLEVEKVFKAGEEVV
ncbi:MAG: N-acetylglucosamine-6-phosphate deacetylase [Bacillota bacterium]